MNWRKWKLGLLVAFIIGFFTACAAGAVLDVVINLKFFLFFIGLIGKDVVLYLKEHKVDDIQFETEQIKRSDTMKMILVLIAGLALGSLTGCKTNQVDRNGQTVLDTNGQPVRVYDPVKTSQVKAALEPIGASAVRRVIVNSPQHAAEIADYFRSVGAVFCAMSASGEFSPTVLIDSADAATARYQGKLDDYVIDIKNALIAVYKINYADRFRAELPPDQWPKNVADVICASIDQGLKDAKQPGVR